jgi:hypothetical protein
MTAARERRRQSYADSIGHVLERGSFTADEGVATEAGKRIRSDEEDWSFNQTPSLAFRLESRAGPAVLSHRAKARCKRKTSCLSKVRDTTGVSRRFLARRKFRLSMG